MSIQTSSHAHSTWVTASISKMPIIIILVFPFCGQIASNTLILRLRVALDAVGKERRFHKMKLERGFDQFISLKALRDAANGFLVDDTCVFGAEVFVCKERTTDKGECLQMIKDPIMYKHTFKVESYSKLAVECSESEEFNAADQKWYLNLFSIKYHHDIVYFLIFS